MVVEEIWVEVIIGKGNVKEIGTGTVNMVLDIEEAIVGERVTEARDEVGLELTSFDLLYHFISFLDVYTSNFMLGSFVVTPSDLHSYPSTNARKPQASGTAPVSHRRTATSGSQHALDPVSPITRTTISLEYMSVIHKSHCPLGMYILPSVDNLLRWDGVLFIHQGVYGDNYSLFASSIKRMPTLVDL